MSTPVVVVQDGAVDELFAVAIAATAPELDLLGVVVVDADCLAVPTMDTTWKVLSVAGRTDVPVGLSAGRGMNPFPWEYREDALSMAAVPSLARLPSNPAWASELPDGDALLESLLSQAAAPVTLLVLSPITPVTDLVARRPDLAARIARIVWMGGAVDVPGNLDPATVPNAPGVRNDYAEWNVFWDPIAGDAAFRLAGVPVTLVPLDVTNLFKVSPTFLAGLAKAGRGGGMALVAAESYDLVTSEPYYCLWDTTAAMVLLEPALFSTATMGLRVETSRLGLLGAILRDDGAPKPVDVVTGVASGVTVDAVEGAILQRIVQATTPA